jgi:hypothetical protein
MEKVIKKVRDVKWETKRLYCVKYSINIGCKYANNAVLIAENEDDLQWLTHIFNITGKQYSMTILVEKN